MSFIVGILTFLLVINCLVLILLVLVQLPKKDAGAGIAFGGGTADALFGAGSGNVLTKITKWATVTLVFLCLGIGWMQDRSHRQNSSTTFEQQVEQKQMEKPVATPSSTAPAATPASQPASSSKSSDNLLANLPTNAPAAK
jgi:preprotein translocase subunit SecG